MTRAARRGRADITTTLALAACFSVGQFAANFAPYFLEALERRAHTDASGAGNLLALEFAAIFAATLVFWRWGRSWSLAWTAYAGILAYVVGSAATAFAADPISVALARTLCGLGGGAALAAANASAASQKDFDTAFSRTIAAAALAACVLFAVIPAALERFGPRIFFLGAAACAGIFAIPALFLRRGERGAVSEFDISKSPAQEKSGGRVTAVALALLSAGFLARLNDSVGWPFNARYSAHSHIEPQVVGPFLGVLTLAVVTAPFLARLLSVRFGYIPTFLGVVLLRALATIGLYYSATFADYAAAQAVLFFGSVMSIQLLAAALAARDGSGRLAVLSAAALMLSDAIGPAIGGQIFRAGDLWGVTVVSAAAPMLAALILLPLALRPAAQTVNKRRTAADSPSSSASGAPQTTETPTKSESAL